MVGYRAIGYISYVLVIYGRFYGGGGGHSDAKWEIFQFSPFFSKMSLVGGGMLYLFEISKKWPFRKGMGLGGVGGHIFEIRGRNFGRFGVCSNNLV